MLKIILLILLVALCTFGGYVLTKKYRQKKQFYYELFLFNDRFITEVTFRKRPLTEFCKSFDYSNDFSNMIDGFLIKKNYKIGLEYLSDDEKSFVEDYFKMLGKSDSKSQTAYLTEIKKEIDNKKALSEADLKKYSDLYIKLGFLFGLIALILLV